MTYVACLKASSSLGHNVHSHDVHHGEEPGNEVERYQGCIEPPKAARGHATSCSPLVRSLGMRLYIM